MAGERAEEKEGREGQRRALVRAVRDAGIDHTAAQHNSTALTPSYLGGRRVDRRVVSDDIFSKQPINTYK